MSHIYRLSPQRILGQKQSPVIIKDQALFDDLLRLANLYQMTNCDFLLEVKINEMKSIADAAVIFFSMIENKYFPLKHMWEGDDVYDNYDETIKHWLEYIPVRALGVDWELEPMYMSEPKALLTRLSQVGNNSPTARKRKQALMYQYPHWSWDGLLDVFHLSQVIDVLDEMFLPPPFNRVPALVRLLNHKTGTYFLDYTTEDWPHYIQWSQSNFDWLTSDWETAKIIMDQSDALCHWLIKNTEQLEKVWTILSVAHKRRKA